MENRHIILGFVLMVGCSVTPSLCSTRNYECPVEHDCQGYGLEDLGLGTSEAAFCQGPDSTPLCFGIYTNGTLIPDGSGSGTTTTTPLNTPTDTPTNTPTDIPTDTPTDTPTPTPTETTPVTPTPTGTIPDTTTDPPSPSCHPASCEGKVPGVYFHQNCDCRLYYTCLQSVVDESVLVMTVHRCTGDQVFDPDTSTCTSDLSVCYVRFA